MSTRRRIIRPASDCHGRQHKRKLLLEKLETRWVLSFVPGAESLVGGQLALDHQDHQLAIAGETQHGTDQDVRSGDYVPGEILIGFESDIADLYLNKGRLRALEAAGKIVGGHGLFSPQSLFHVPATSGRAARLVTRWQLPENVDIKSIVAELSLLPGVAYAEPNGRVSIDSHEVDGNPGDPSLTGDWGDPPGLQEHLLQLKAEAAWDISTGGDTDVGTAVRGSNDSGSTFGSNLEVIVAVIDTGVDVDHPDLDGNILHDGSGNPIGFSALDNNSSYNSASYKSQAKGGIPGPPGNGGGGGGSTGPTFADNNGHGTHVAGIIAAEINNLADLAAEANGEASWTGGVVGVAPRASILPIKVLDAGGGGSHEDVAEGILYAAGWNFESDQPGQRRADIINMSLGGGFSETVKTAVEAAFTAGVLVISSAGNGNYQGSGYPAAYAESLSVAAVDKFDQRASFSNYGDTVDIAAPGVSILSTFIDLDDAGESGSFTGAFGRISGTSMASPVVAGTAALIKSLNPSWEPIQVAAQLLATTALANFQLGMDGNDIDSLNPGYEGMLGAGRVDALAAIGDQVTTPVIVSVGGLGADGGTLHRLESGSIISVQFSHQMDPDSVMTSSNYLLMDSNGTSIPLSLVGNYDNFPGRGVRLQVAGNLDNGSYEFRVKDSIVNANQQALDGDFVDGEGGDYVRTFSIASKPLSTTVVPPFGAMIYQGATSDRIQSSVAPYVSGVDYPAEMEFGPGGGLYISSLATDQVLKFNMVTGVLETFVSAGSGGLDGPRALSFGPDGNLYVAGSYADGVFVYASDGTFIRQLDADGTGGLDFPTGLVFVGDDLYVSSNGTGLILKYDTAGNSDNFTVFAGGDELNSPQGIVYQDGNFYVASYNSHSVLKYNSVGTFQETFVGGGAGGLRYPLALAFADTIGDGNLELHVTSNGTDEVLRFSSTGDSIDAYLQEGDGGIQGPTGILFDEAGDVYVSSASGQRVVRLMDIDQDGQVDRGIGGESDIDQFTLELDGDPDQVVTVRVQSTAGLNVTVMHDGVSGSSDVTPVVDYDSGAGVLYQAIGPLPAGTLTISVASPDSLSSRAYDVEVTLNAIQEVEPNDTSGSAQPMIGVIDVKPASGDYPSLLRGAVLGRVEGNVDRVYAETETSVTNLRGSWDPMFSDAWAINGGQGVVGSVGGGNDGSDTFEFFAHAGDVVSIRTRGSASGGGSLKTAWVDLHNSFGDQIALGTAVAGRGPTSKLLIM